MPPSSLGPKSVMSCRRRGRRIDCRLHASLIVDDTFVACTVEDLSPRGARIMVQGQLSIEGMAGRLEIPKLGATFRADVAWVRGEEIGLRLTVEKVSPVAAAPKPEPAPTPKVEEAPPRRIVPYGRHKPAAALTTR